MRHLGTGKLLGLPVFLSDGIVRRVFGRVKTRKRFLINLFIIGQSRGNVAPHMAALSYNMASGSAKFCTETQQEDTNMRRITSGFILLTATFALATTASAREFADIYTDCGLGAMIAPNNDAVAAVTNVTWDLGTTAILSNASSPDTCQGGGEASAMFIHDAYPSIEKDLASGEGEHLSALLKIAGVAADQQTEVSAALRAHLAELVTAEDYDSQTRFQKAEALYNALQAEIAS